MRQVCSYSSYFLLDSINDLSSATHHIFAAPKAFAERFESASHRNKTTSRNCAERGALTRVVRVALWSDDHPAAPFSEVRVAVG